MMTYIPVHATFTSIVPDPRLLDPGLLDQAHCIHKEISLPAEISDDDDEMDPGTPDQHYDTDFGHCGHWIR